MTARLDYLKIAPDPRGGAPRHYFRFNGKTARLRGEPGSADYLAHHAELLALCLAGKGPAKAVAKPTQAPAVVVMPPRPRRAIDAMLAPAPVVAPERVAYLPGSIGWTIERYLGSGEFGSKQPGTQKNYRILLDALKAKLGAGMIADLNMKHVTLFCREVQEERGPSRGRAMLAVISNVWQFALGLVEANMPDDPRNPTTYAQVSSYISEQHKAWPESVREQFLDGAADHLHLMFALLLYTGQRRSDVAVMRWERYDRKAGFIHVWQKKTKEYVPVPVHKRLAKILAETPRNGEFILTSAWSQHYRGESSVSHAIRNRLVKAGVPDGVYTCHGLRVTAGHMLAEAGANEVEIMRILGHTKPDQAHYYIRHASKPKVTRAGMAKWDAADAEAA